MRTMIAVVALLGSVACGLNPVQPSSYTCRTQPREYVKVNADGSVTRTLEADTYESATPCPVVPIK